MIEIKPIFIDFHTFHFFKCTWSIHSIPYLLYNNGLFTFSAIKMAVHYTYSYSAVTTVFGIFLFCLSKLIRDSPFVPNAASLSRLPIDKSYLG